MLDVFQPGERDPRADFETVNRELAMFDGELGRKPQIVAASKMDLVADRGEVERLESFFEARGYRFCAVSAVTGEGLERLKTMVADGLAERNAPAGSAAAARDLEWHG